MKHRLANAILGLLCIAVPTSLRADDDTLRDLSTNAIPGEVAKWDGAAWRLAHDNVGVDAVVAGSGLSAVSSNGTVNIAVQYCGSGTNTTVARSDHDHDAYTSGLRYAGRLYHAWEGPNWEETIDLTAFSSNFIRMVGVAGAGYVDGGAGHSLYLSMWDNASSTWRTTTLVPEESIRSLDLLLSPPLIQVVGPSLPPSVRGTVVGATRTQGGQGATTSEAFFYEFNCTTTNSLLLKITSSGMHHGHSGCDIRFYVFQPPMSSPSEGL